MAADQSRRRGVQMRGNPDEAGLAEMGYLDLTRRGSKLYAVKPGAQTASIVIGLDVHGRFEAKYCFETKPQASQALAMWDGLSDPPGPWIVYEDGLGNRRLNERFGNEDGD